MVRTIVLLLLATAPAHAEPTAKSPNKALALSLVPTILGAGALITGIVVATADNQNAFYLDPTTHQYVSEARPWTRPVGLTMSIVGGLAFLVGPSLGHIYAGHTWNAGIAVRLVGLGVGALGARILTSGHSFDDGTLLPSLAIIAGGGVTFLVGTTIEVATVPRAVRRFDAGVSIAPISARAGTVPGLVVGGRF